jgi:predicted membrane chloride channel (bestrophin family)
MAYAPMYVRERETINNLNYIYNNGDVESVNMLRMKKVAFNQLVNTLGGCSGTTSTPVSKSYNQKTDI